MKTYKFSRLFVATALALLLLSAFSACTEDPQDLGDVENYIVKRDTVWTPGSPIIVRGQMRVEGATLTIQAGTRIQFARGAQLIVGKESAASLRVQGTADNPVIFEPRSGEGWSGIQLMSTAKKTALSHLQIKGGGDSNNPALRIRELSFPIDNLKIDAAQGVGLAIVKATSGASISALSVASETDHAITLNAEALRYIPASSTTTAQEGKGIRITGGTAIADRIDLKSQNYYISGQVSLNADQLNMGPNANFYCEPSAWLIIGEELSTRLTCKRCLFTSSKDKEHKHPGQWSGLQLKEKTLANSIIDRCTFEAGGGYGGGAGLTIVGVSGIRVKNSTFRLNRGPGIGCQDCTLNPDGKGTNTFNGNTSGTVAQL